MDHANIVKFYRAFSFEKCTYIVLELCPNGSLMDMVKKRKFITEPEVRFWTVQMAGAIKYMHAKGIIHRDLKMGNIFLDKNMNVKVGDFGLAALLMSGKDMHSVRRTTLCGTPNYIAPEILEKGKGGHDHMVDIWSLGIIIFAMLTGKPPFQSTTADEIYRRAREREYDWPKLETSENFISEETKDLVSTLLQGPDKRPDPDTIVQHPFFTCGWMPQSEEMTPELCDQQPHPTQFLSAGIRSGRGNLYARNLKKLCIKCEVGPWSEPIKYRSTYKEVAAEEKAHLTPMVPLAEDIVYRPFQEWLQEQQVLKEQERAASEVADSSVMVIDKPPSLPIPRASSTRQTTQSYAAQQRSRPAVASSSSSQSSRPGPQQPDGEIRPSTITSTEVVPKPLISVSKRLPQSDDSRRLEGRMEPTTPIVDVENRLAVDMARQMNKAELERKSRESEAPVIFTKTASIFDPKEKLELVPGTKPDAVFESTRRCLAELDRALNSRTIAIETPSPPNPPVVVKWVDYTNKYGLGYILDNGTVGTIFKGKADSQSSRSFIPPTCLVVREGEQHLLSRGNENYVDRFQVVPVSGPHIEFYENRGVEGLLQTKVDPRNFVVPEPTDGKLGSLSAGRDQWDFRKKEMLTLWKKFSNYMTTYSREYESINSEDLAQMPRQHGLSSAADVVTFWQRWGDVSCWVFGDGHLQVLISCLPHFSITC
jgi:serine/threonine protein kinase